MESFSIFIAFFSISLIMLCNFNCAVVYLLNLLLCILLFVGAVNRITSLIFLLELSLVYKQALIFVWVFYVPELLNLVDFINSKSLL